MKSQDLILIAAAAAVLFVVMRKYGATPARSPITNVYDTKAITVAAPNGWQYFTDGTAIDPKGVYYYQGQQVYDPAGMYGGGL